MYIYMWHISDYDEYEWLMLCYVVMLCINWIVMFYVLPGGYIKDVQFMLNTTFTYFIYGIRGLALDWF